MGIRYIRDGGNDQGFYDNLNDLHATCGIKSTLVFDPRDGLTPQNAVTSGILPVINSIDVVEGPNEWDVQPSLKFNGKAFPDGVREYANALYQAVKGSADAHVHALKVASPTMANPYNSSKLGSVACDLGAMHSYSGSPNLPDDQLTSKWIPNTQLICPSKP